MKAKGFQKDDKAKTEPEEQEKLLDIMTEYSDIFTAHGIADDKAFQIITEGLEKGVLGTDKIADCIKGGD